MKDEQITTALTTKAVTIRINGGSQEAQYLAAYYPVPVLPALIIIDNGQLVVDIRAGETKIHFKAAILSALSSTSSQSQRRPRSQIPIPGPSVTQYIPDQTVPQVQTLPRMTYSTPSSSDQPDVSSSSTCLGSAASPPHLSQPTVRDPDSDALSSTARNTVDHANLPLSSSQDVGLAAVVPSNANQLMASSSDSSSAQPSQTVQNLLADRRRRLEIDKTAKDAAEKAERKAKAETRKEAMTVAPDSAKAKQATYAAQQRKRQQEAKVERERIVRQIEHDKAERKEREERRKAIARAETGGTDGAAGLVDQQLASESKFPKSAKSTECAIQIRLFDGSTIRSRFAPDCSLRGDVRPWIDREKSDDIPYMFKQVLTPMPNRTLSISEEEESLQSLGLSPNATLVISPVQSYTAAYNGGQGFVSRGATAGYNVISAGADLVTGALGTFLGLGRATAPVEVPKPNGKRAQESAEADKLGTALSPNIRTLRDQEDSQKDHQLYNGNQVPSFALLPIHLN